MDRADTPSLYPRVPSPLSPQKSYSYEPSAPPSLPHSTPGSSSTLHLDLAYSPSAPPPPSLTLPVHDPWLTASQIAHSHSHYSPPPPSSYTPPTVQDPWRAASHSPTEADLEPEPDRLYPWEPSASLHYSTLPHLDQHHGLYPNESMLSYHMDNNHPQRIYPRFDHSPSVLQSQSEYSSQRLRELYENEHLKNLPQRLIDYQAKATARVNDEDTESEFFDHMRLYEAAHEAVQQSKLAIFNLQQKAKGYASKLWIVQTKSEVAKATCGDGAAISHSYSYKFGHHEPEVAAKLKKSLNRLFKQRTKSLVRLQFEETSCRLWIQDHIATFLHGILWKNGAGGPGVQQDVGKTPRTSASSNGTDLGLIMRYLDMLFQFEESVRRQPDFEAEAEERKATTALSELALVKGNDGAKPGGSPTNSILQSIQQWIALLAATLLQHGGIMEYEYLTIQVLRRRQVSGWAANLIQCNVPTVWSSTFQDYYITQLELVFCGSSMRNLRQTRPQSSVLPDLPILGSDLEEDDYLALLDQLDMPLFLNRLLLEHQEMHSNDGSILQSDLSKRKALRLFTTTRHFFDIILHGLQRLTKLAVVSKRMSQMLCQLAQILGDHLLVLGPASSSKQGSSADINISLDRDTETTPQVEIDHILVDITRALFALPGHGIWPFLPSVPFRFMSSLTIALVLEELALDNIHRCINDPSTLLSTSPELNKLRDTLGSNPGEAVFLLTAMATMATSRFLESHDHQSSHSPSLDHSIARIATFLLLDVAYLNGDIRGELAKPARELLSSICDSYPAVFGFVLQFVATNFKEMGDMAQYLFRGLPLQEWRISSDDFSTLKKLLEASPLSSQQSLFARYVFCSLPWSFEVRESFENEDRMRVPIVFRKELALTMADICIQHLSHIPSEAESPSAETIKDNREASPASPSQTKSPESKFVPSFASSLPHAITNLAAHSGIHRSAEQTSLKLFMDWCWNMLGKLDLLGVPSLTLVEASRLHVQDLGLAKYPLFNQGQLTFVNTVHLLLTEASRNAEQFLKEGWTTLTALLQAGVGNVFLNLAGMLIRPLIGGGDSAEHARRFGQLLRDMASWKQDPMLAAVGAQYVDSENILPEKASKEQLGVWCLLRSHLRQSQSLSNEPTKVIMFWISALFSLKDWMAHQECVQVLDVVCLFCFELGLDGVIRDALTEQQILLSIGFRRAPGMPTELMGLAQPGLDRVMDMLPERFQKSLPVPQGSNDPSLLMGTWSMRSFAANLLTQQAMVETNSIWFAYYVLTIETSLEREMRIKVGNYYRQHPAEFKVTGNIKTVMKILAITSRKTLHNFAIWRWAQHLLVLPFDTYLLPLFWQMFFYLYFGHTGQRDLFYGHKFLETNPELVDHLRERLQKTYTYFGQEARKAIQDLDARRAAPLTALNEFYIALYGWISEPLLLTAEIDLKRIRKDLMAERLITCRLPDPLECNSDLWKDLLVDSKVVILPALVPSTPSSSSTRSPPTSRGSPRSYDQARAMRKHSHAWQEQKISNCLAKHSRLGPEFFVPHILVQPMTVDDKTSPQSMFCGPTRIIREYCRAYRATNEAYEKLDASYLTELGALYHNELKNLTLEIACDTTPNALCKRPAVIELKYEEIVLNDQVRMSIVENRERARASRLGSVEQGLCLAALEISKNIAVLLQRTTLSGGNNNSDALTALQGLSVRSFYFLCKELLEDARVFPPAHIILSSVVGTLGLEIVAKDPSQTEPVLDLMQTDDFTIAMMFKTFYPAALPREFVRLYQRIATCKEYGLVSKDLLLRQFDVQAWAVDCLPGQCLGAEGRERDAGKKGLVNYGPSILGRLAFYEVAFTAMVAQQQLQRQDDQIQEATELSTRDRLAIIKSHREVAGTLFLNFLQQDYIEYLRILFNTCGIMCLEPEVLEDFIRILGVEPRLIPVLLDGADVSEEASGGGQRGKAFTNVGLSDYDLGCLVQFLADYFSGCQESMARGNLLDRYSGYAVSIASLLTVVLCDERYLGGKWMKSFPESIGYSVTPSYGYTDRPNDWNRSSPEGNGRLSSRPGEGEELVNPGQCRMWRDTLTVFRPWLSCLTKHAVDETRFQRQQSGASRLLFTFVGIVSKMMGALQKHYRDANPMLAEVFGIWLEMTHESTLGQGCINQTMLVHQHLQRLEWKGLELSWDRVERALEVAAELTDETKVEFWTYLITIVMEKANSDLRPRALMGETSKFTVEWHQTESVFLKLGLTIIQDLDLVAGNDVELRQVYLDRLWATIFDAGDWTLMSTDELKSHIISLKVHWDRAGAWDDLTSPLGVLLYWMRIAVGLESTDMDELDIQEGVDYRRERTISLNEDRVLVYFEYVMRLLQTRLASSAQDSQNVNFRMDAVPLVITHLGQVLDRIAGSRHQEKHHQIHRSLAALVGVLNQCGKGSLSSTSSPSSQSYSHAFDVVQRGLARMISDVEVIQLDMVKVVCQRVNSIPAMIYLLEEAIEREFDIWDGQQGSSSSFGGSISAGGSGGGHIGTAGSVFGLEDTMALQTVSLIPMMSHHQHASRSLHQYHQQRYSIHGEGAEGGARGGAGIDGGRQSWARIKAQIEAPELSEDEFLEQALKQGAILTIYGRFLQRLEDCEQGGLDFDEVLGLGQELAEVISKLDLMVVVEPWKAYQSLLLLRMFFSLVAKESVHNILQSRFLNALKQICRMMELWCQDRDSTRGMLSSIGMGTRSSFDTKFRLVIRIIYTYVVVRLADKGVSIHQSATQGGPGGGGGMLAWRKARQNSGQQSPGDGRGSPLESGITGNMKDASAALIELLAQLGVKNRDYAAVFVPISASATSVDNMALTGGSASSTIMSMSIPVVGSPISLIPTLASSPLEIVKKTIMSSTPLSSSTPPTRPVSSTSSSPAGATSGTGGSSPRPGMGYREGKISHHNRSSSSSVARRRLSFQSHHSRFSLGSGGSWDETAGSVALFEEMTEPNGGPSTTGQKLVATRRRFGKTTDLHRMRLMQGTKNGVQDLEWAVQQVKDRRFRILEAAELLEEVLERFYEGDDYFA